MCDHKTNKELREKQTKIIGHLDPIIRNECYTYSEDRV